MKTIYQLEDFELSGQPLSLTIGNFDGVHLGHQAIFSQLKGQKVVFTFSNHPFEVLKSRSFHRLTTPLHRLHLFRTYGIETTILLPFTEAFSKQTADSFLDTLRKHVPFTHLLLGHDGVIGRDREGNSAILQELAAKHGFHLSYLPPVEHRGAIVSSSAIRDLIQNGNLREAGDLLGRPYSIRTAVEPGVQQGRLLGFRTANLNVHNLCLPPLGVYSVHTQIEGKTFWGVANLGHAPTLHAERPPLLEVHLIDYEGELYGQEVDIVFCRFLRAEKRFESIEALKNQIHVDIQSALADRKKAAD